MVNKKKNTKEIIKSVASKKKEKDNKIEKMVQFVVFELDGEEYGVDIMELKEITNALDITFVPNSPNFILGVTNLRGEVVVVIDLEKRFKLIREKEMDIEKKHVIISEVEGNTFGVIVDQVVEVMRVPVSQIKKAPSLVSVKISSDFVVGVVLSDNNEKKDIILNKEKQEVVKDSRLIIIVDLVKMLSEKELLEIGGLAKDIQAKK